MPNNKTIREEEWEVNWKSVLQQKLFNIPLSPKTVIGVVLTVERLFDYHTNQRLIQELQEIEEWGHKKRDDVDKDLYCRNETNDWKNGYDCAMIDLISALKEKKEELTNKL